MNVEEALKAASRCDRATEMVRRTLNLQGVEAAVALVISLRARGKFFWPESEVLIALLKEMA